MPKVAAAATDPKLRTAIEEHLEETCGHVTNLEKVFASLDAQSESKTCPAMKALIRKAEELIAQGAGGDSAVLDASLIGGA